MHSFDSGSGASAPAGGPPAGTADARAQTLTFSGRIALLPAGFLMVIACLVREGWEYSPVSRFFGIVLALALICVGVISLVKPRRILDVAGLALAAAAVGGLAMQATYGTAMTIFAIFGWLAAVAAFVLLLVQFLAAGPTIPNRKISTAAFTPTPLAYPPQGQAPYPSQPQAAPQQQPQPQTAPVQALPDGWYPDPSDPSQVRYWAGGAWTEHAQPAPQA